MRRNRALAMCGLLAAGLSSAAAPANAAFRSFHTFRIVEVFSSVDGAVQFIELKESSNFNGQSFWTGHDLVATSGDGMTSHTLTFASDLPNTSTSGKRVLVATANFAALAGVTPNYIIPAGFVFSGGTVNFADVSTVTVSSLPSNGVNSLNFPGNTSAANSPTNFAGVTGSANVPGGSCCNGSVCSVASAPGCAAAFTQGGICSPNPCSPAPTGACCNGTACAVVAAASCSGGQTYQGNGSACGPAGNPTTCCRANFNQAGGVAVQDIFDFLSAYFLNAPAADFNGAGGVTVQDIFDFLAAYFLGCPG